MRSNVTKLSMSLAIALVLSLAMSATLVLGCSNRGPTDDTPEGALRLFIDAMRMRDRAAAYALLAPASQQELQSRAQTATKQGGRSFAPDEMLVAERFVLRWEIARMEEDIQGNRATVTVTGAETSQSAEVELQRVDGRWRVILPI
jgi:hypothetical protein